MLNVAITVDTEFWPDPVASLDAYAPAIARDLYGVTPQGEYGIGFQARTLSEHGLKAVFHVEALSATLAGNGPNRDAVGVLREYGQEIQLHLHTEWLDRGAPILPGRSGIHMRNFSVEEQASLLRAGASLLEECGSGKICAFRAGNFGANWDTLRALSSVSIPYDTSYNHCYLGKATDMGGVLHFLQPRCIEGVWEFPVSYFRDFPGHYRPAHLRACSFSELSSALDQAYDQGWDYFVIVSHSFELINRKSLRPDKIVLRRFLRLCQYLADNSDRFRTFGFHDIQEPTRELRPGAPLRSPTYRSLGRMATQLWRRFA